MHRAAALTSLVVAVAVPVSAQNWSVDARRIALGGVGDARNPALELVEAQRGYRAIVIPLGLFQVLRDLTIYDPGDDNFDPVRAAEYVASPIHYTFDRDASDSGQRFIEDIVDAALDRDLNTYRGFRPADEFVGEGLAAPNWGKTFLVRRDAGGAFHGIYVGAGPYLSIATESRIDPDLIDLLASDVDVVVPNARFGVADETIDQVALAITGGYRARVPWPGRPTMAGRDGIYLAANYHYLYGFHYDDFDMRLRFETDASGLLTVDPATAPAVIERLTASEGRGLAVDLGLAVVVDRWDLGFAVTGIANRIVWTDVQREQFVLQSLLDGGEFVDTPLGPLGIDQRIELPVNYAGTVAFHADRWTAMADYAYGFQDHNVHGGLEYALGRAEVRGGMRFSRDRWHPSAGVGIDLTSGVGLDVALFGTSTNVERRRHAALAVSFRLRPDRPAP